MNKKHRHALFVSFALSLVAATAHGADAVVASPDGRTMLRIAEDGGAQAETLTVKDARSLEAALLQARTDKRIRRIEFASGSYALAAPIVIDEVLSGTADEPFVLTAAPGARPLLSGATPLPALRWERWKDGIWRARFAGASFQRLWLGQHMLVRARYPNLDRAHTGFGGAADATSPERVARWRDPQGAVLHALHGYGWGGLQVAILGKKPDGSLDHGPQLANNRVMPPSDKDRYVENVLEELDAPGEWFHDRREGWLYVKPLAGGRPPARGFRGTVQDALICIEGRGAQVQHVQVRNLVFRETESTFLKATEPLLRSDWKFYRAGAVTIENAGDCFGIPRPVSHRHHASKTPTSSSRPAVLDAPTAATQPNTPQLISCPVCPCPSRPLLPRLKGHQGA